MVRIGRARREDAGRFWNFRGRKGGNGATLTLHPFWRLKHSVAMMRSVAFVGAGPTTIYTLHALLEHATQPFSLTIFEEQPVAGRGTPYRPGWNDPAMLSNIASIEIPPLAETLVTWLQRQPAARLTALGIDPDEIDERAFYPRLALGEFFRDQFHALIEQARSRDIAVDVQTGRRVLDAVSHPSGISLTIQPRQGQAILARFDHLVLATGHQWPVHPEVRPGYFLSPWPASALAEIPPSKVGIRGTSLTAIDAAVALAVANGDFIEDGDRLRYQPAPATEQFSLTMLSRKGLLPEADFFHPIPYEPLTICTAEAVERLIARQAGDLLDDTFWLFKQELAAADPNYAARLNLADLTLDDFAERYFSDRIEADTFAWAEANLREAERNYADRTTVPWRYAILRMHEVVGLIVPHLDDDDFDRFTRRFKSVFIDDYATVPHESIKRMLALHKAGKLDIVAVGDDYRIDGHPPEGGAIVRVGDRRLHFPIFVEATGQRPLGSKDFPFPSLRGQGIVRDETAPGDERRLRGIAVDDEFHLVSDQVPVDQLFCLSLPFLLGRHPFTQGITSSHEMGAIVGKELAAALG
jgi:uncharacterized NAD(P)/FAD-binding protein YdhS